MEATADERSVLDRGTKAAALRLSRRRFAGNVLAAGAVAWAVQLLGFATPSAYALDCTTNCTCCTGQCDCLYSPISSCCSPNGQVCIGGNCTCQGRDCNCACFAYFLNVCNDGSWGDSCPRCGTCPTCSPC